jgi:ankyrin repeat protein
MQEVINMKDKDGNTPLLVAAKLFTEDDHQTIEILKILLKFKASALTPDLDDCYPIDIFSINVKI